MEWPLTHDDGDAPEDRADSTIQDSCALAPTRHAGYPVSQRIRKKIGQSFGWIKMISGQAKTKFRGEARVGFTFSATSYKLVRMPKLLETGNREAPA
jgi:hypothetical protein